jgi:hypothetical protein
MKRRRKMPKAIAPIMLVVLFVLAGCGGDRDITVNVYVGDQATQTAAVESTQPVNMPEPTTVPAEVAQSAEPTATAEPVGPTAVPEATAAPTEPHPTEAPVAPSPESTTAPPPEATVAPPPTEAPQLPDAEYAFDPAAWEASLTSLSSFRQKVGLDFTADGTGVHSKAAYVGEATTNPTALHSTLTVEGEAASQLPANQVEVIWIGDQAWVKVGRRPWVQVPATALESEYGGQVVGVGELLPYIPQAHRVMPDESINGIACKHYVYDINDLQIESGMTDAKGDIWVAKDGGYVVRLTMNGHGTYYDTYSASGTLNLIYDLYDVNASISINPPR